MVMCALRNVWKDRSMFLRGKMDMSDGIVVLLVLYGWKGVKKTKM